MHTTWDGGHVATRKSVVSQRDSSAHQCQGNAGSISGHPDVCQRQARDPCSVKGRQHHCNVLHQSQGRHTLSCFDESHFRDLELVPAEKDFSVSRASTEHCSRSGIENSGGQFGVETRSECVLTGDVRPRTMPDQSVCLKTHSPTSSLHKLETRPRINDYRCDESELVNSEVLCLPTFLSHRKVPSQSKLVLIAPVWLTQLWFL